MHVLSRNDAFLVYALLRKFSLHKCRSREFFDLFQVWLFHEWSSCLLKTQCATPSSTLVFCHIKIFQQLKLKQ